jgi:hypothetical protein
MDLNEESIPIPPDTAYGSYDEAYNALKQHGLRFGYGFRIRDSRPYNSSIKTRVYYCCDKRGQYESQAQVRSTKSRADNCPFKLVIYQEESQWKLKVLNKHHSHSPSLDPRTHHVYRRRTPAQKETIRSQSHITPKDIMTTLKQDDPETLISNQDIRNERHAARVTGLNGRTAIEALLDDLSSSPEWIYDVRYDIDNHIEYLFFMHEKQRELLLANPDILLMDCTYRTNRYRLPLLHMVGCTNLETFFSAGFCFLRQETEQDYYWAVSTFLHRSGAPKPCVFISDQEEALRSAVHQLLPSVPRLLCVWHINKNVLTKAQHVWRDANGNTPQEKEEITQKRTDFMARWKGVVYTKTEAAFNIKW